MFRVVDRSVQGYRILSIYITRHQSSPNFHVREQFNVIQVIDESNALSTRTTLIVIELEAFACQAGGRMIRAWISVVGAIWKVAAPTIL